MIWDDLGMISVLLPNRHSGHQRRQNGHFHGLKQLSALSSELSKSLRLVGSNFLKKTFHRESAPLLREIEWLKRAPPNESKMW